MYFVVEKISRTALQSMSFIFMARYLGPETFGNIGFVSSVLAIMSVITIFGLDQLVIRSAAKANINALHVALRASSLSLMIGLLLGLILASTAVLAPTSFDRDALILLSMAVPMAFAVITQAYLMTIRHNKWLTLVLVIEAIGLSLTRIAFCVFGAQAFWFVILILVDATLVAIISAIALLISSKRPIRALFDFRGYKVMLLSATPLAATTVVAFMYMRVDQFMVRVFDSSESLGIYLVALKFIEMASILVTTLFRNHMPTLLRELQKDEIGFFFAIEPMLSKVFVLAGTTSCALFFFGKEVATAVFGASYAESGTILAVLILSIPALIIGQYSVMISVSRSSFSLPFFRTLFGLVVNVLGNGILIPVLGGLGAAIATVIAFWSSTVLSLLFTKEDRPLFFATIRAATLTWILR
jgi:O-antigen/teichoic acid export membrane protein